MKKYSIYLLLVTLALNLQSCELIGDIFKAGVWTGIIFVVVIIALVIWLVSKIF